jgi:hypothetical protein
MTSQRVILHGEILFIFTDSLFQRDYIVPTNQSQNQFKQKPQI